MNSAAPNLPGAAVVSLVDHLVVVAETLDQGLGWCETTLGVLPGPGGRHPLMGTHNRLLPIGGPDWPQAYLEIIAIDPAAREAPAAGRARWFDMDNPALQSAVRAAPQLVHFVAQTRSLTHACAALAALGQDVGEAVATSRPGPQGELRWRITLRRDGVPGQRGALPAMIEWDGPHPSTTMAPVGVQLRRLVVAAEDAGALRLAHRAIGLQAVECHPLAPGGSPLQATLSTPRGEVVLRGGTCLPTRSTA